jgi:RNA polymerase sigma factor (sigma-70 family)
MSEAAVPGGPGLGAGVMGVLSDDRLAQRAVQGDERAFAAIFRRYHQALYRYCLAIVGDPREAEDALQNTMVKVLRALPGEERRIELKPWLYRIAHNESIELLRHRRETRRLDPELAAAGSGLAEEAATRERLRGLISDLDELPERQRGALVMRELAGLGFAEIGTALGSSPAVARQTLYEARLSLRQMDEGRAMSCEKVTRALSDGDGRVTRRRDVRAHLRSCSSCRSFEAEIKGRKRDFAALSPLPAVAAAGLLQGLLGGSGGGGGGGALAGALGGGAAKSLGGSAALKGAATVAVVAAIGVGAADRGGLIHVGLPGDGDSPASPAGRPADTGPAGEQPTEAGSPAAIGPAVGSAAAKRKGAGGLDASRSVKPGPGKTAVPPVDKAKAALVPASSSTPVTHPHGKEHEKQLPDASAHGQQTAAAHKSAHHGSAGTKAHPAHPPKPSHPIQASNPSSEKGHLSPPASEATPEAPSTESEATQGKGGKKVPPGHEGGEKP